MRITAHRFYAYRLPLARPLAVRGSEAKMREGALLMVQSAGGAMGWGDIAPLPGVSPESLPEAIRCVEQELPSLSGRTLVAPDILQRAPRPCGSAAFALDSALLQCMAAEAGMPMGMVFADDVADAVLVNALVDGDPQDAVPAAEAAVSAGFRSLKVKVGRRDPAAEARMVIDIRERVGDAVSLRLDANRAWSLDDAKAFIAALEGTSFEYLEEPLRDPGDLPKLQAPVALDESLARPGWESLGAVAAVIKPSLQDGLAGAVRLAGRARMHGMRPVISSLFESGVGVRTLASLAAGIGDPGVAHGLGTLDWFMEDVAEPAPRVYDGRMSTEAESMPVLNANVTEFCS